MESTETYSQAKSFSSPASAGLMPSQLAGFVLPFKDLPASASPFTEIFFSSRFLRRICIVQRAVVLRASFLAGFAFATMLFIKRLD
jgi:hypothetical protein